MVSRDSPMRVRSATMMGFAQSEAPIVEIFSRKTTLMSTDPYAPCPCGSGKKVKFCCSDLVSEMEKVGRMLEGDQPAACLAHVKQVSQKHPGRASLLGLQAMLEIQLEKNDDARATIDEFLAKHPDDPRAWAQRAILDSRTDGGLAAVEPLQRAFAQIEESIPREVMLALGVVGHMLFSQGEFLSARAHLLQQLVFTDEEHPQASLTLMQLHREPQIPLLLKDDWQLARAPDSVPDSVPWKAAFDEAIQSAYRGAWRKAERQWTELLSTAGDAPQIWWNLGLVRAWLADRPGAVEALRRYASLDIPRDDVQLDDAVEAEALAQLLDDSAEPELIDVVKIAQSIRDPAGVQSALAASDRAIATELDDFDEESPPPRAIFELLDKPMPSNADGLTTESVPCIMATVLIFGKETDREARLEIYAERTKLDAAQSLLREICGDDLSRPHASSDDYSEEVVHQITALASAMQWQGKLPPNTSRERYQQLLRENQRKAFFQTWPGLRLSQLGGRTPTEAAQDPQLQIPVLAAVLVLETSSRVGADDVPFDELRRQLGLPVCEPVDLAQFKGTLIPAVRLRRLIADRLTDDELVENYRRAVMFQDREGIRKLGGEIVGRETLADKVDFDEVYRTLVGLEQDPDKSLHYVEQGRAAAEAAGRSSAPWDLAEMDLHLMRGEMDAATKIFEHLQKRHLNEPGVRERLYEILVALGAIGPDGQPTARAAEADSNLVLPSGEAPPGEIWTPGGEQGSQEKQGKLWTPGMD